MRKVVPFLLIALISTPSLIGCQASENPDSPTTRSQQESEQPTATDTAGDSHTSTLAESDVFDSTTWKQQPKFEHDRDMAIEVERKNLTQGMTLGEVAELLGPFEIQGIPVDYPSVGGSAGVGYQTAGGGSLSIDFEDGYAIRATFLGMTSEVELDVSGVWKVEGGLRLEQLELRTDGGLIRMLRREKDGPLVQGFGHWSMPDSGKLLFYNMRFDDSDIASVYEYHLEDNRMTLTWVDETVDTGVMEDRVSVSGHWIAGEPQETLELVRPH